MKTYFEKPVTFMYFWLNYCDKNHIERIPIAVKNMDHLFRMACEIIEFDVFNLFNLLSDGTGIDDNEYLSSLENGTELIVCTEEQTQKLSFCFKLKSYLSLKNISYSMRIKNNFHVHRSGTCLAFFKVFLIVFTYTLNKR